MKSYIHIWTTFVRVLKRREITYDFGVKKIERYSTKIWKPLNIRNCSHIVRKKIDRL